MRTRGESKIFDSLLLTGVTIILSTLQVFAGAYVFMILIGVISAELSSSVTPISYISSLVILGLVEIILTIMRFSTDTKEVIKEILDEPPHSD